MLSERAGVFDYSSAVEGPMVATRDYARFSTSSEMPGVGVCGFQLTIGK